MNDNYLQYMAELSVRKPLIFELGVRNGSIDVHFTDINGNNILHTLASIIKYEETIGYGEAVEQAIEDYGTWDIHDSSAYHRYIGKHYDAGEDLVIKYRVNPFQKNNNEQTPMDIHHNFLHGIREKLRMLGILGVFNPPNDYKTATMRVISRKLFDTLN
jgi:hypothetical protein